MTMPAQNNPFADPIQPPSTYPSVASLRGRLVLITPHKIEQKPSRLNPGQTQEQITASVSVVDGLGPVPDMNENTHTGQWLEGPEFTGVWISGTRLVDQLRSYVGTGQSVLGVIETYQPGQVPRKGNPWGINTATDAQKAQATQYLATRTIGAAAAPAPAQQAPAPAQPQYTTAPAMQQYTAPASQPQPQYAQQAPTQANPPYPVPANQPPMHAPQYPQPAAPPAAAPAQAPAPYAPAAAPAPAAPAPGPGANPFLPQAQAPAPAPAPAPAQQQVNPFLPPQ